MAIQPGKSPKSNPETEWLLSHRGKSVEFHFLDGSRLETRIIAVNPYNILTDAGLLYKNALKLVRVRS